MMGSYIWTQPRRCSYLGSYIWTQPISCYLPAIMPSTVQKYGCLHQDPAQLLIYLRHSRSRNERESSKRRESSGSFQLVTISGPIKRWTVSHVIVSNNQCCEQECSNSKDLNNKSWFNGVKIVLLTGRGKKS